MTAQATEKLIYKNEVLPLCDEPLRRYFELMGMPSPFAAPHTALWRGYVGTWEIIDTRLYLVHLKGFVRSDQKGVSVNNQVVGLDFLFPDFPDRIFAHWVSGRLRATKGGVLKYVHGGFMSVYEQDIFLEFKDGHLQSVTVKDNEIPVQEEEADAPGRPNVLDLLFGRNKTRQSDDE
jgi:hypothetical protein